MHSGVFHSHVRSLLPVEASCLCQTASKFRPQSNLEITRIQEIAVVILAAEQITYATLSEVDRVVRL